MARSNGVFKKWVGRFFGLLLLLFMALNIIAAIHAYKFTHFSAKGSRTENIRLTFVKKIQLLFTGVDNPRPVNSKLPSGKYKTIIINSVVKTECWYLTSDSSVKGTVILFHGYTADKGLLVPRAAPFLKNCYNCLLVDFMGSGGSGGNSTTVGFDEARQVADCYRYIKNSGEQHIFLYGSSMGAVAIMKAIHDSAIQPTASILECPFATMYETIAIRFKNLGVPTFPMAGLLLFWGGVENGFWAAGHNPVDYAKSINTPVLLQYGLKDDRVAYSETQRIYKNIAGEKQLVTYPQAGHDDYMDKCPVECSSNMIGFLNKYSAKK